MQEREGRRLCRQAKRLRASLILCAALGLCASCTTTSYVAFMPQSATDPNTDGKYVVKGYAHAKDWNTTLFQILPIGEDLDHCSSTFVSGYGANNVGPVTLHTESYTINPAIAWAHYGGFLPYIIGTRCNYVSTTVVSPQ